MERFIGIKSKNFGKRDQTGFYFATIWRTEALGNDQMEV